MPDYQKTKIYEIIYNDKRYIGHTTGNLNTRFLRHKIDKNCCSQDFDFKCSKINVLELYPCNTLFEARIKEQEYINNLECINKNRAYRSDREKQDYKNKQNNEYYHRVQKHSQEYKDKKNEKIFCEACQMDIVKRSRNRHYQTKKHINNTFKK